MSGFPWESLRTQWYYLPNILGYLRIAAAWVPAWLLVTGFQDAPQQWWAVGVFTLIAASDGLDGFIARRFNLQSEWGAALDPIADKLLVLVSLIGVCWAYISQPLGWMFVSVSLLIVAREIVLPVQIKRVLGYVVPPTFLGKLKTAIQMLMIVVWMMPGSAQWVQGIRLLSVAAVAYITVISWRQYYRLYVDTRTPRK